MLVNFPIQPVWNTLARRAPTPVKRWYRRIARPADFALEKELERLESFPRYVRTTTNLLGSVITMVDSPSFLAQYGSIFRREKYRFRARRPDPTILDCGANIGMMTIYWKRLYPLARITAFEPDPDVFSVLSWNITQLGYPDVVLHQCAVWTSPGEFAFWAEGADAGRLMRPHNTNRPACLVEAVRLRDYLDSEIDMLKLDIEGAEVEVILDSADKLHNIQNILIEYHSFHSQKQRIDELMHALLSADFRIHVLPDTVSKQPFVSRSDNFGMDLQLDVFAFRP